MTVMKICEVPEGLDAGHHADRDVGPACERPEALKGIGIGIAKEYYLSE